MRAKFTIMAVLAGLFAGASQAQVNIAFHTGFAGPGGSVSYPGGVAPLVASGIPLQFLSANNTPSNAGSYLLSGDGGFARLAFTTGNFVSYSSGIYTFAG